MTTKRTEYGEHDDRTPGDRRRCMAVDEKNCDDKHHYMGKLIDHRFEAMDLALSLRTKEVDNHFAHLNNAQARLDRDRDEFLRLELYKSEHQNLVDRVDKQSVKMGEIEKWRAGLEGKASLSNFIAVLAIVISLVFSILHFIKPN
jgi:hypothetical protein